MKQEVLEKKKTSEMLVECKKKIEVQWQEIKGVRDEIKSKWKKNDERK